MAPGNTRQLTDHDVLTSDHDVLTTVHDYDVLTTDPLSQASMYGHRAASPYSLTPPPSLSRYSPGAGPASGLPPHHPGLGFPHLGHPHLPHVKHDFDRPPGLLHPDDKVGKPFLNNQIVYKCFSLGQSLTQEEGTSHQETFECFHVVYEGRQNLLSYIPTLNLQSSTLILQEMRPVVQAECTLKESAAINQILGRRVSLSRPKIVHHIMYFE